MTDEELEPGHYIATRDDATGQGFAQEAASAHKTRRLHKKGGPLISPLQPSYPTGIFAGWTRPKYEKICGKLPGDFLRPARSWPT